MNLIEHLLEEVEGKKTTIEPDIAAQRLKDHYADLSKEYIFNVGMLIRRKSGLGTNIRFPEEGQPALITHIKRNSDFKEDKSGAVTREDIVVMVLYNNNMPVELAFDSRYFEPYTRKTDK